MIRTSSRLIFCIATVSLAVGFGVGQWTKKFKSGRSSAADSKAAESGGNQEPEARRGQPPGLSAGEALFAWREGALVKRDGKWCFRSAGGAGGDGSGLEVRAFPWYGFARPGGSDASPDGIRPFPWYPPEKHKRDGHHYPVDERGRWFGALCRDEQDFEEFITLMLTIKGELGEDPPGRNPVFEGAGFYIVTSY